MVADLNRFLLAELVRAVQFSGEFHKQFANDTSALLGGRNYGMYRNYTDYQPPQFTRHQFPRDQARHADMTRFY